jgi:serine protease Do
MEAGSMSSSGSRAALGALLVCALSGVAQADPVAEIEAHQRQMFQRLAPSVVYIMNKGGIGSGFFVSSDGLILTNSHVVHGAEIVLVVLHGGGKFEGRVVERASEDIDLALVRIAKTGTPPLVVGGAPLGVGDWVASVGHGADSPWTYTVGMVSNIYPHKRSRPVFQTQIPLNPGSSGSPIVNRAGRVVGIVTAGIKEASSVNFAIRAEVALASLPRLGDHCQCIVVIAPRATPIFVDGQMAGTGPRAVVPVEPGSHELSAVVGGQLRERRIEFPAVRKVDLTR